MGESTATLWLTGHDLEPGEQIAWSKNANRFQGSRALGGKLRLTDRRLLFAPNRLDALLRGRSWQAGLGQISSVGVEPRGSANKSLFGGGARNRLRLRTADGGEELFVINGLDETLDRLTEAGLRRESEAESGAVNPLRRAE